MFDLYTLICCLSFILLIVWFLFTEHVEEPSSSTPPLPKKKVDKDSKLVKEIVSECVGAVEDAVALQEELDTEKEELLRTIRRRLKPSGASSGQD